MKKEITIKVNVPEGHEAIWNDKENKIEFKKLNEPKTWEEYCKNTELKGKWFINDVSDICQVRIRTNDTFNCAFDKAYMYSKEEAEAFLALMQLRLLRKAWVGERESDWQNGYCIAIYQNEISTFKDCINSALSFPTEEIAKEFLECFRDLIEQAKILL